MIIISFLLLVGPGAVVWEICDSKKTEKAVDVLRTVLTFILDCFIIFVASYLTLFILYGQCKVSFSPTYMADVSKSVYSVGFVWKYGVMAGVYGIILGCVKLLIRRIRRTRKTKAAVASVKGKAASEKAVAAVGTEETVSEMAAEAGAEEPESEKESAAKTEDAAKRD